MDALARPVFFAAASPKSEDIFSGEGKVVRLRCDGNKDTAEQTVYYLAHR